MTLLAALTGSSGAQPAARALVQPGLWEITVVAEDAATHRRLTSASRSCFSAADAGRVEQLLPALREAGLQCQNSEPKAEGTRVSWQIACTGKTGNLAGAGVLDLTGGGYLGRADLAAAKAPARAASSVRYFSGRWIQACS